MLFVSSLMHRSLPIGQMSILGLVGFAALSVPFLGSLWPSERANASIPRVKMPKLLPAQFAFVDEPSTPYNWPSQILFVRQPDGQTNAWRIPIRDGLHGLPDIHWWQRGQSCQRFGPDFSSKTIGCWDSTLGEWAQKHYRWSLNGKNLVGHVDDLERIDGVEEAGEYALVKAK